MFIRDHRGQSINLSLAATTTPKPARDLTVTEFRDARGTSIGTLPENLDVELLTAPLLPAGPVQVMVCVGPAGEVAAAPIAGWRILRDRAEPVFVIQPPPDTVQFLALGTHGLVRVDNGMVYQDLAAARKSVVGEARSEDEPGAVEIEQPKVAAGGRRR